MLSAPHEIARHESGSPRLKRTPKVRINDLPPELLAEIFCMWRYSIWVDTAEIMAEVDHSWLKVLTLCRYWYTILALF